MDESAGVQAARERLLTAVRSGAWERVPAEADAYGAAVRADERRRVVDDALEAVKGVFQSDDGTPRSPDEWRERCLTALGRLY